MSEVLHANIFFFIASLGVVLFIILTSIILYQVIKIAIAVRRLVERIEAGSEALAADMISVREYVTEKGTFFSQLFSFFTGATTSHRRRRSRRGQSAAERTVEEE